jgi:hypothetical protein
MSKKTEKRYWFRSKKYGWGWGLPLTWQGWVSFAVAFGVWLAALAFFVVLPDTSKPIPTSSIIALFAVITLDVLGLIYVSFKYGEPPKWHWGSKHGRSKKS